MAEKRALTPDLIVSRNDQQFLISQIGEEVVMMDVLNGKYLSLNGVGSDIWHHLSMEISIQQLITEMADKYNVSLAQCRQDVLAYLNNMLDHDMLIIRE